MRAIHSRIQQRPTFLYNRHLTRSVIKVFNPVKASLFVICFLCLATAAIPKVSWADVSTERGDRQLPSSFVTNPPINTLFNTDRGLISLDQSRCQVEFSNPIYLAQGRIVLCELWLSDTIVVQRVQYQQYYEGCFDETIDTQTWTLLSSTPAPCTCPIYLY
jgi:hypothetical protein